MKKFLNSSPLTPFKANRFPEHFKGHGHDIKT